MRKVRINYNGLTQSDFNDFLTYSTGRLTGNASFPNPPEDLVDITSMQTDWQQELGKSRQGDHQATQDAGEMQPDGANGATRFPLFLNNLSSG